MTPFLFRCPKTGLMVQGLYTPDEPSDDRDPLDEDYVGIDCLSCGSQHLVNPRTGRVLGQARD